MGTLTSLGSASKTTFLAINPHKIHVEFDADTTIKNGQPVKLTAEGKVTPWAKTDALALFIGTAYTQQLETAEEDETVTIITRGNVMVFAMVASAGDAGPATWASYDTTTADGNGNMGYNVYEPAAANTAIGWILDQTAVDDAVVRVLTL